MSYPFKKRTPVILEKDCEFQLGIRRGRVLDLRAEGYFVFWEAWTDPASGECHDSLAGVISYEAIVLEDKHGKLKVLKRPLAAPAPRDLVRRAERTAVEIARVQVRKHYALAIQEMVDAGELELVRDDFEAKIIKILARGKNRYDEYIAAKARRKSKRAGAQIRKSHEERQKEFEFSQGVKSGRTFWKWYWQWAAGGEDGLFDRYRNCGGHSRYCEGTRSFVCAIIDTLLDQERVTIKSIVESVQAAIGAENDRRERLPIPGEKLPKVGYNYVTGCLFDIAPIDHAIRRHGKDRAQKDMHAIGIGVETTRALERVEIDEYTVDLAVLMRDTSLFDHLPASIKHFIGLDGTACRVTLSAAIDVHTRCLVALQIVPRAHESPLRDTVEMIYTDKSPISDAAGCKFKWEQGGAPEAIVLDRGSKYITDEAYAVLASLGITNLGAPAGKPWLKGFIERLFRTIHNDLLLRFSGRTFSNVVEKDENNAVERATLTLEAFLGWLVRWTVDAYHTRVHSALGMSPAQAWKKAIKECEPRSLSGQELREAFGVRTTRLIGKKGVCVKYVDYQNDASIALKFEPGIDRVEVLRWHGDIGAISIRADNGPWTTVTAMDPRWIGKTDADLVAWLSSRGEEIEAEQLARRDFINAANDESFRLKRIAGLISLPRTAEELERDVARFSRHTDTAERRHEFGEYRDILGDLDASPEAKAPQNDTRTLEVGMPISDAGLME